MSPSTNDAFAPALTPLTRTELTDDVHCVMEIVIDGLSDGDVAAAMRDGIASVVALGPREGALRISAGNYGGKLGPFHFHLHQLASAGGAA
jgi:formylmethanofuran--tetrahydromethanopterin N-formyltransferase